MHFAIMLEKACSFQIHLRVVKPLAPILNEFKDIY